MKKIALALGFLGCAGIAGLGTRFLVSPQKATLAYGLQPNDVRGLTAIKGVRDIASGLVLFTVWLAAGQRTFGWALVAASMTPSGTRASSWPGRAVRRQRSGSTA